MSLIGKFRESFVDEGQASCVFPLHMGVLGWDDGSMDTTSIRVRRSVAASLCPGDADFDKCGVHDKVFSRILAEALFSAYNGFDTQWKALM